jgi:hypothetical protein
MTKAIVVNGTPAERQSIEQALEVLGYSFECYPCLLSGVQACSRDTQLLFTPDEDSEFNLSDFLRFVQQNNYLPLVKTIGFGSSSANLGQLQQLGLCEFLVLPMSVEEICFRLERLRKMPSVDAQPETEEGVLGRFQAVPLTDFIQMLVAAGSNGTLEVDFGQHRGMLYFSSGQAIHAEFGELQGEDAFLEILRSSQRGGGFKYMRCSQEAAELFQHSSITRRTDHLLLALASKLDEQGADSK